MLQRTYYPTMSADGLPRPSIAAIHALTASHALELGVLTQICQPAGFSGPKLHPPAVSAAHNAGSSIFDRDKKLPCICLLPENYNGLWIIKNPVFFETDFSPFSALVSGTKKRELRSNLLGHASWTLGGPLHHLGPSVDVRDATQQPIFDTTPGSGRDLSHPCLKTRFRQVVLPSVEVSIA